MIPKEKRLTISNGRIELTCPFTREVVLELGKIRGLQYIKKEKVWVGRMGDFHLLKKVAGYADAHGFVVTVTIRNQLALLEERIAPHLEASQATEGDIVVDGLKGELYPFQKAGVEYMVNHPKTLLADEMGLGKTVQALAFLEHLDSFPAIVVSPAIVKRVWEKEVAEWLPHRTTSLIQGRAIPENGYEKADLVVINYDILHYHVRPLKAQIRPKAVVFDEIHYAKSSKAKRSKACRYLGKDIERRIGISGTPVLNRPSELPYQLTILGVLKRHFRSSWHFLQQYTNAAHNGFGWEFKGGKNLEELNEKLRVAGYVRRKKSEVLTELPEKIYSSQVVSISNRGEYQEAENDIVRWIGEQAILDKEFKEEIAHYSFVQQKAMMKHRRNSAEWKARSAKRLVWLTTLKRLAAIGKIKKVADWVENFSHSGEKLVIFAHHREVVTGLVEDLGEHRTAHLYGGMADGERRKNLDRFIEGDAQFIVISIKAGGIGLDGLQRVASNVLFVELAWTPADHWQAEDRVHRVGQNDGVAVWYILGENTIDELLHSILVGKTSLIDATLDGADTATDNSIFRKIVKEFEKRGKT